MTDDPDERDECDRETSDGEIEIEITRGSSADRSIDGADRRGRRNDRDVSSPERELADELGRIDVMTTPEGYVEGRVTDVTAVDATTVRLSVSLPHGETASFALEKPIPWSREFLLARLVEDVGYDAASIDHVVGEPVYLARADLEPDADEEWWESSVRAASDALLSSLSGGRYRLERTDDPEWRLVDPLERRSLENDRSSGIDATTAAAWLSILVAPLLSAVGVALATTGELAVSSALVGYALGGFVLALIGLALLSGDDQGA
ncbi:hypothetical protein [Natrarchaeobius oligotrophus]|uniref:Uncharacterized protein n=1 Tax=Natrarchaeobius chitinivorans TaxID=1679083 RepID=A0A3N6MA08_NATCH|nr:hypothetical protein [Natrarchaeobius chitinivorans]RQG97484.1 hypothetical protein EA472_19180 [Natrarchaeobius chitinivorans]